MMTRDMLHQDLKQLPTKALLNCFVWSTKPAQKVAKPTAEPGQVGAPDLMSNGNPNGELNYPCTGSPIPGSTSSPTPETEIVLFVLNGIICTTIFGDLFNCDNENSKYKLELKFCDLFNGQYCAPPSVNFKIGLIKRERKIKREGECTFIW